MNEKQKLFTRHSIGTRIAALFMLLILVITGVMTYVSIGLHDASWRSVFGGDQYIFNGSHGCINIPEAAMVKIFNNIEDGTPVLIFGQNKWYQPGSADSPATKNPLRGTTARQ